MKNSKDLKKIATNLKGELESTSSKKDNINFSKDINKFPLESNKIKGPSFSIFNQEVSRDDLLKHNPRIFEEKDSAFNTLRMGKVDEKTKQDHQKALIQKVFGDQARFFSSAFKRAEIKNLSKNLSENVDEVIIGFTKGDIFGYNTKHPVLILKLGDDDYIAYMLKSSKLNPKDQNIQKLLNGDILTDGQKTETFVDIRGQKLTQQTVDNLLATENPNQKITKKFSDKKNINTDHLIILIEQLI